MWNSLAFVFNMWIPVNGYCIMLANAIESIIHLIEQRNFDEIKEE